jgi:hypothetical protein
MQVGTEKKARSNATMCVGHQQDSSVAAPHGREHGCAEEILPSLTDVVYVVIFDKSDMYDSQKTVPCYTRRARAARFVTKGLEKQGDRIMFPLSLRRSAA